MTKFLLPKKFQEELDRKIDALCDFPKKYRASYYFESDAYRDMIYCGYTVIYKLQEDTIEILDIFKWQNR
jgi:plasmid stabilization system protein ParE